jgi:hypothetical protein
MCIASVFAARALQAAALQPGWLLQRLPPARKAGAHVRSRQAPHRGAWVSAASGLQRFAHPSYRRTPLLACATSCRSWRPVAAQPPLHMHAYACTA